MVAVFQVQADSCSEAWFKTLIKVLTEGDEVKTQYDSPNDPPSRDATVQIVINKPFTNQYSIAGKPRLIESRDYHNKYYLDCHPCDLFCIESVRSNYIEEVLLGTQDENIAKSEASMPYTYHDRLFNYKAYSLEDSVHINYPSILFRKEDIMNNNKLIKAGLIENESLVNPYGLNIPLDKLLSMNHSNDSLPLSVYDLPKINQVNEMIKQLVQAPHTRRAQAITWRPYSDNNREDPPCLQRLWARVVNNELTFQVDFRSRDLFKAFEANYNAYSLIAKRIADEIGVKLGTIVDRSNSLHIYGKYFKELATNIEIAVNKGEFTPNDFEREKITEWCDKYGLNKPF